MSKEWRLFLGLASATVATTVGLSIVTLLQGPSLLSVAIPAAAAVAVFVVVAGASVWGDWVPGVAVGVLLVVVIVTALWAWSADESLRSTLATGAVIVIAACTPLIFTYTPVGTTLPVGRAIETLATLDRRKAGEGRAAIEKFIDWRQDQWRRLARGAAAVAISTGVTLLGLALAHGAVETKVTSSGSDEVAVAVVDALNLGDEQQDLKTELTDALSASTEKSATDIAEEIYDTLTPVDPKHSHPLDDVTNRTAFAALIDDTVAGGTKVETTISESNETNIETVLAFAAVFLAVAAYAWFAGIYTQSSYMDGLSQLGHKLGDPPQTKDPEPTRLIIGGGSRPVEFREVP